MRRNPIGRLGAVIAVLAQVAILSNAPVAFAIERPSADPALVPQDGTPGPDEPMRQSNLCATTIALPQPDVGLPAPAFGMLNISQAWQHSTGNGVSIAVIDTGVTPSPRLRVIPGGDYITGGDGLSDCDSHGTVVASLINAAPKGVPMPSPLPAAPAFPAPIGVPQVIDTPPPIDGSEPPPQDTGKSDEAEPTNPDALEPALPEPDGVAGVAPHATVISIRQSSRAYEPESPAGGDHEARRKAGTVATLARAVVHAANLGAQVINVSVTACVSAADSLDQGALGAAVWYAATVKDAVIVAAAGNEGEDGCAQNPLFDPLDTADPRDWRHVRTVSSPSWFSDYVLSVGAVDHTGAPLDKSLAGPWVGVVAPGVGLVGLSAQTGDPVNAYPPIRPGEESNPFWGTSFASAYVSGVAALVRAKYPDLSAHQVVNRILQTAHNPPRGVDNKVGYGLIDPVAALTFDVPPGDLVAHGAETRVVMPPPDPVPPDRRARTVAVAFSGTLAGAVVLSWVASRARRSR